MDKKLPPLKQSPLISSRQNSIKSPKPGSQQLQQLHLQGLIQKRIDLIIAKMFENIEMMIQERPFYVLNEAELNCDPMTDHENPKNIYPIFKTFSERIKSEGRADAAAGHRPRATVLLQHGKLKISHGRPGGPSAATRQISRIAGL